jgi:hypothetical protein
MSRNPRAVPACVPHHRHHQRQGRRGQDLRGRQPGRGPGPRGQRVLVLDADLGLANLDVVLNLFPKRHAARRVHRQSHAGRRHCRRRAASRCCWRARAGGVLAHDARGTRPAAERDRRGRAALRPRAARHRRRHLRRGAVTPVSLAGEVLIVATPEPTSLTDAYATIKVLATTQGRRRIACWSTRRASPAKGASCGSNCSRWSTATSAPRCQRRCGWTCWAKCRWTRPCAKRCSAGNC